MGVPSSPARAAPRAAGHSIGFYLAAGLIVPVTLVLVLWGVITGLVLGGGLDRLRWLSTTTPSHRALIGAAVIVGAGLIVVITVVIRVVWFAGRLGEQISRLTAVASSLADEQLPRIVAALRTGEQVADDSAGQWPDLNIPDVGAAAEAIGRLYRAAVTAAVAEAALRNGFRQILVSLGRRNQSLLHRQLRIIDGLEQQAVNPAALADLFTLDHLTTRMRRHAESLTILSGAASGRSWNGPVPVIDVMRAATAEVEDYTRVTVVTDSEEAVTANAVTDMIHLLAELIENATLFSPSTTRVEGRAERVANGFAIEVEDRGLGIPYDQLAEINAQLANPPDFDLADADRLGLFVAGRLAARHGVYVELTPSAYRGTKAVVVMPDSIVVPRAEAGVPGASRPGAGLAAGRPARLNVGAPEVLTLAGAMLTGPQLTEPGHDLAPGAEALVEVPSALAPSALAEVPSATTTIHGLPRRVRPAPPPEPAPGDWEEQLPADGGGSGFRPAPVESPAPEHARTLAASLQNSWQRSRQTDQLPDRAPDSAPENEES